MLWNTVKIILLKCGKRWNGYKFLVKKNFAETKKELTNTFNLRKQIKNVAHL